VEGDKDQEKGRPMSPMTDDFPWQNATPSFLDNKKRCLPFFHLAPTHQKTFSCPLNLLCMLQLAT
jgi:hypothetical protein